MRRSSSILAAWRSVSGARTGKFLKRRQRGHHRRQHQLYQLEQRRRRRAGEDAAHLPMEKRWRRPAAVHLSRRERGDEGFRAAAPKDVRRMAHKLAKRAVQVLHARDWPVRARIGERARAPAGKMCSSRLGWRRNAVASAGGINTLPTSRPMAAWRFNFVRSGKPDIYVSKNAAARRKCWCRRAHGTGVAYSPDMRRIAYSLADGESGEVVHRQRRWRFAAAAHQHALSSSNTSPTWSPDGAKARVRFEIARHSQVYLMSSEGGEARRLTFQGNSTRRPTGARAEI